LCYRSKRSFLIQQKWLKLCKTGGLKRSDEKVSPQANCVVQQVVDISTCLKLIFI
jgi:hypothetical protein